MNPGCLVDKKVAPERAVWLSHRLHPVLQAEDQPLGPEIFSSQMFLNFKKVGQKEKKCTPTSDAECETPDGFFCSISADKGAFSEATLSCQPHTICDSGVQIQPGTDSTDSTCIKYVAIAFIIGCMCFIISLVLGALFYRWLKMERDLTGGPHLVVLKSECLLLFLANQCGVLN
ncbi:unnamed protein product [Boreogadus saida]